MSRMLPVSTRVTFLVLLALLTNIGCLPRTSVTKNPGPRDHGLRYYRPKPYLFIKPVVIEEQGLAQGFVEISIEYLPDYSEEYSIHVRSGLGTNDTKIVLDNGWRLSSLNVAIDSKFDENLNAIGNLINKATPILTEARGAAPNASQGPDMVVRALNVPMGLYEAVISQADGDQKRLYGFRYVGFFPYSTCPIESNGVDCRTCYDDQVYGLVFENGCMVFKLLLEAAEHLDTNRGVTSELANYSLTALRNQVAQAAASNFASLTNVPVQNAASADQHPDLLIITLGVENSDSMIFNARPAAEREGVLIQVAENVRKELKAQVAMQIRVVPAN